MPRKDRTGLLEAGPMNGRRAGVCSAYADYVSESPPGPGTEFTGPVMRVSGKGSRYWGRTSGSCWRRWETSGMRLKKDCVEGNEIEILEERAKQCESMLRDIQQRLSVLKEDK